eukprot:scaffold626_cov409-Prasinococcus_capsulatus_cf.AAC.19
MADLRGPSGEFRSGSKSGLVGGGSANLPDAAPSCVQEAWSRRCRGALSWPWPRQPDSAAWVAAAPPVPYPTLP